MANFALTVNVTEDGDMFGQVLRNPGELGEWLEDMGAVDISVRNEDGEHSLSGFGEKDLDRSFPVMCGRYSDSPVIGSDIGIKAFCPLSVNDAETSSLPVLMAEFRYPIRLAEAIRSALSCGLIRRYLMMQPRIRAACPV